MKSCICESCRNLKDIIDEQNGETYAECEYGLIDECCTSCELDGCELTCENFIKIEDIPTKTVKCKHCGKSIIVTDTGENDENVFCIDCYFKK